MPWILAAVGAFVLSGLVTAALLNRATRHAVDDPSDTIAEAHPWDRELDDLIRESVD